MPDHDAEIDAAVKFLRDIVNKAAIDALGRSEEARQIIDRLADFDLKAVLKVSVATASLSTPLERAQRLAAEPRLCPYCKTAKMKGNVVRERVSGQDEQEVIEGMQVRFYCSLCGFGDVAPILPE